MIIDAHIHLDWYNQESRNQILNELSSSQIDALISVSSDLESCKQNLQLAHYEPRIKPAFGFHPEQPLPSAKELEEIFSLIRKYRDEITAVGEVGLPYYLRKEDPTIELDPYVKILEQFIQIAAEVDLPIILHAIYEDADLVCNLLEKHAVKKAHFHWFKGSSLTVRRMINQQFMISVTPDCLYEPEIEELIRQYPLTGLMVETDGPWPFEGRFKHQLTHPKMMHHSVTKISELKGIAATDVYRHLYENTVKFYSLGSVKSPY